MGKMGGRGAGRGRKMDKKKKKKLLMIIMMMMMITKIFLLFSCDISAKIRCREQP